MILDRLTLSDIGVFKGEHVFELHPKKKYGSTRPIVLFGGLNGSGKTTILTSIRLALYGRQALGDGLSQRAYAEALRHLIHRDPESVIPTIRAEVALEFLYWHAGQQVSYRVVRVWEDRGRSVEEYLGIFKDGTEVSGLSQDQGQSFLNHLVPPGISQFFFFDGEKIASLARDDSDDILAESVRKLLGLDLVEKVRSDLTVLLRQKRSEQAGSAKAEYDTHEQQLTELESESTQALNFVRDELSPKIEQAKARAAHIRARLADRGSEWAVDRQSLEQSLDKLFEERGRLEGGVRDRIGGLIPFAVAPSLRARVLSELKHDEALAKSNVLASVLDENLGGLAKLLSGELTQDQASKATRVIKQFIKNSRAGQPKTGVPRIELSDADRKRIQRELAESLPSELKEFSAVSNQLSKVSEEIAQVSLQLSRAPSDEALKDIFLELQAASEEVGRLMQQRRALLDEARKKTWLSIDLVRKLRHAEEKMTQKSASDVGYQRAELALGMLQSFATQVAKSKVVLLQNHFVTAFRRLSRKEDMVVDVRIDPASFAATLYDRHGQIIPKDRLSAGEKQIFAIAMLEALAMTCDRKLPIIIDTPLGRLDSRHRTKLVQSYFPRASHQVIVLSTDTEVDEPFYQGLSKHVSHAYHLAFDEIAATTTAEHGYFWRTKASEQHAA